MERKYAKIAYHGSGGELFVLMLVNAILTVLTLGIYSFWARNKVRAYHYSHFEMDGDRFAYHGTGAELLIGALKATGILIVVFVGYVLLNMALGIEDTTSVPGAAPDPRQLTSVIVFYSIFIILSVLAVNGARRYRLSRSEWRGIRFSFHGHYGSFLGMILKGTLLSIVTLGFYLPFFQSERRAFLVNNARFGSEPFIYKGEGRPLFFPYLKALLLTIPTLGLSWIWYAAFKHRYFWNHTEMRGARFQSSVEGSQILVLSLTNLLLVAFTFGIASPWVIARTQAFWAEKLLLVGTVEWASIQQRAQQATGTGEGLAEGLDLDVGVGM